MQLTQVWARDKKRFEVEMVLKKGGRKLGCKKALRQGESKEWGGGGGGGRMSKHWKRTQNRYNLTER